MRAAGAGIIVAPADRPFKMPSDAAVGAGGDLYVLDGVNNRVVVFDAGGQFRFTFGKRGKGFGQLFFPLGIGTGPGGEVYIADSGNHRIQVFTPEGKPSAALPLPDSPSGKPPDPTDVAVDPVQSRLFIADNDNHRLLIYSFSTNSFEAVWGKAGRGPLQFRFPFLLDITADGYPLVVESINTRVQVINPRGKFVGFIGGWGVRAAQLFRPKGVAAWGERIFISDGYLGRIQIFDIRGRFIAVLAGPEGKPLDFQTPTGITMDRQRKRLYVVELKANRVRRVDLE